MTDPDRALPAHSPAYLQALAVAADRHLTQRRKGTDVPYLSHLLAVSSMVWDDGGSEAEAIAALLHDVVEDTPMTHREVAERFGDEVSVIVADCTDAVEEPKAPWRERKEAHLDHVAGIDRPGTLRVVCADKTSNAEAQLADHLACGGDPAAELEFGGYYALDAAELARRLGGHGGAEAAPEVVRGWFDRVHGRTAADASEVLAALWADRS